MRQVALTVHCAAVYAGHLSVARAAKDASNPSVVMAVIKHIACVIRRAAYLAAAGQGDAKLTGGRVPDLAVSLDECLHASASRNGK